MNIFRLKGKIFHFINFCFYFVVFIFGYLCGSSKINISKFFQIDNVYAVYGDAPQYNVNYVNYYFLETSSTWNSSSYGYRPNNRPMSDYQNFQTSLESHHVYNYLEQVTRYLTDNYSGDYEFIIIYFKATSDVPYYSVTNLLQTYSNYRNNSFGSSIYIYYFPKESISEFYSYYGTSRIYPVGNPRTSLSNTCLNNFNGCSDSYIPGSGFDIIPISTFNGSSESWYLDSAWSSNNGINIVDYLHYVPNFINYKSLLQSKLSDNNFWNQIISLDNGVYANDIPNLRQEFTNALNDLRFIYPDFEHAWYYDPTSLSSSGNPSTYGSLYYYSSVPIINNTIQGVTSQPQYFFIGSHAFAPGEVIPTYADVRGYQFTNLHNYSDISDFMDFQDYRVVCSQTQALMINSYGSDAPVNVFVPEDWLGNDNFVTYDFYSYDVDSGVNTKLESNNNYFQSNYLSLGNINEFGFPDFLEGFTFISFLPSGTNNFVISRSDFNTDLYSMNLILPNNLSNSHSYDNNYFNYYDPVNGLTTDENNYFPLHMPTKDGNWCVYVSEDIKVTSLSVDNADVYRSLPNNPYQLNKQNISFSGIYLDENGIPHNFEYTNPLIPIGNSVWSYSDSFVSSNKNTLTFIGSLSSYFFDNVHSSFLMFCVVALIILIFIKILNFYNGGDR